MTAVVEERVNRFLQHALFVADDDVRRLELEQVLETVVAVDDAAIEIVQIGGRKPAALERNERTQIRRNDRQHFEHHPFGTRVRGGKALHELQTFREFLANLFALGVAHRLLELLVQLGELDFGEEHLDRVRAHAGVEILRRTAPALRDIPPRSGAASSCSGVLPGSMTM